MALEVAPDLSPEQQLLLAEMRAEAETEGDLPPPSARFQAKMDDQALTNAVLARPGPERDAYLEVMDMPYGEFEREYSDVLNANADDDDGTGAAYEPPPGPPADSAAAYAAVDRRRRGHLRGLDEGEPAA